MTKKQLKNKTFRQRDTEETRGKKAFRLREINEMEDIQQMKEYIQSKCSCLDSAYERQAIDQGLVTSPVFPENKEYIRGKS